jgi:ankyrin repeat protein
MMKKITLTALTLLMLAGSIQQTSCSQNNRHQLLKKVFGIGLIGTAVVICSYLAYEGYTAYQNHGAAEKLKREFTSSMGISAKIENVENDALALIKKALAGGFDIETKNSKQRTLLSWACEHEYVNIVKFLCTRHANPTTKDFENVTPLHIACEKGNLNIVKLLTPYLELKDINTDQIITPLNVACASANKNALEIVKHLVEQGADVNAVDDVGSGLRITPLLTCLTSVRPEDQQLEILKYLISKGADPEVKFTGNQTNQTIIDLAKIRKKTKIVAYLEQVQKEKKTK